ncbi:hypothetical protein HDU81_001944 [Chytriomyces hyalinus]|nr:hypothetical protein HDU81_001939 [Chytriomyces hyalinus]KAJ3233881.1 hypothetical protein HDU81_001944 [Chytriomyces hyalinus]
MVMTATFNDIIATTTRPAPSPAYTFVSYHKGGASRTHEFNERIDGGCVNRFHLDSAMVPQFENNATLCGEASDMTSQFFALFRLFPEGDEIHNDYLPDGSYVIQIFSHHFDKRDGLVDQNGGWTFNYQGVAALPSTTSSDVTSATQTTNTAESSSTASSTNAFESSTESTVSETSKTEATGTVPVVTQSRQSAIGNLYEAGASTASILTLGSIAAMVLLF